MAAIPDFVSGAMENWGLVTYREARLFYDKRTSSTSDKEGVVLVIGHEFAHMWFGNLGNDFFFMVFIIFYMIPMTDEINIHVGLFFFFFFYF